MLLYPLFRCTLSLLPLYSLQPFTPYLVNWSKCNKLAINLTKTNELVFRKPSVISLGLPDCISDVRRVDECRLLGVLVTSFSLMDRCVDYILSVVTEPVCLLGQMMNQDLGWNVLNVLFHASVVSHIVYALPAVSGIFVWVQPFRINNSNNNNNNNNNKVILMFTGSTSRALKPSRCDLKHLANTYSDCDRRIHQS